MKAPVCETHHAPIHVGAAGAAAPGHEHGHEHAADAHDHAHRAPSRRALALCCAITAAAMLAEIAGGLWTGSLLLLSDAAHMASHAAALAVSYVAIGLATRPRSARFHYGHYRTEILAAFLNGLALLGFTVWIGWEAFQRLRAPPVVRGPEMTVIAAGGLAVNLLTAWILARTGAQDLNTRSAFLHMLSDTISSVAVVIGGVALWATGLAWIDPALSFLVAGVVLHWGVLLVRDSAGVLLERSPRHIEPAAVRALLLGEVGGIQDVHDLHVWEITSGYVCLTAHLVVPDAPISEIEPLLARSRALVRERLGIGHVTFELERAERR